MYTTLCLSVYQTWVKWDQLNPKCIDGEPNSGDYWIGFLNWIEDSEIT